MGARPPSRSLSRMSTPAVDAAAEHARADPGDDPTARCLLWARSASAISRGSRRYIQGCRTAMEGRVAEGCWRIPRLNKVEAKPGSATGATQISDPDQRRGAFHSAPQDFRTAGYQPTSVTVRYLAVFQEVGGKWLLQRLDEKRDDPGARRSDAFDKMSARPTLAFLILQQEADTMSLRRYLGSGPRSVGGAAWAATLAAIAQLPGTPRGRVSSHRERAPYSPAKSVQLRGPGRGQQRTTC